MRFRTCLLCLFPLWVSFLSTPGCATYDTSLLLDAPAGGAGGEQNQGGNESGGAGSGGQAGQEQGGAGTGGNEQGGAGQGGGEQGGAGQGGEPGCNDCNDGNPCTNDLCKQGVCTHTADDTIVPEQLIGNCRSEVCQGGKLSNPVDDQDLPIDDTNPCTQETCTEGVSGKLLLNDVPCQFGGKDGYCKTGECQIDCNKAEDCNDTNPCTTDTCTSGKCAFTPLSNGTPPPGVQDTVGDCKKNVCKDGQPEVEENLSDLPPGTECKIPICSSSGPSLENKTNGTACTQGGQVCVDGTCQSNTCGDGVRIGDEECDGDDLNGKTCADSGFGSGSAGLKCDASCKLDATKCNSVCGNNVKEPGEECDDTTSPAKAGDGCSEYCKIEPVVGDLVITEIMYNPEAAPVSGGTELGEWFEVYNSTSDKTYDVRGLQITSKSAGELHKIIGKTPLLIPPQTYVVFTRGSNETDTNGVIPFYSYDPKISLGNSGDDYVQLEIPTSPVLALDKVEYTAKATYAGKSYSLDPTKISVTANDSFSNFCPAKTEYGVAKDGSKDRGTPGAPNDSCP